MADLQPQATAARALKPPPGGAGATATALNQPQQAAPVPSATPATAAPASVAPAPAVGPSHEDLLGEAYRRHMLPPDMASAYEEAVKRHVIADPRNVGLHDEAARDLGLTVGGLRVGAGEVSDYVKLQRGQLPDVDYDAGSGNMFTKYLVANSDNPQEVHLVLSHMYGPGNFGQDHGGRWWVREGGKKVEVYGGGQYVGTEMEKALYGFYAYTPTMAGALTGGVLGSEAGPWGTVGGAAGGAVIGKATSELFKALGNFYAKTPWEEVKTLGQEAIWNAAFEAISPFAKFVLKPMWNSFILKVTKITPEGAAMTSEIIRGGGKPQLETSVPGLSALIYDQKLRKYIMGDPKDPGNVAYIRSQLVQALVKHGDFGEEEADEIIEQLMRKEAAVSGAEASRGVSDVVQRHIQNIEGQARAAVEAAHSGLSAEIEEIKAATLRADPGRLEFEGKPFGQQTADVLIGERSRFGRAMSDAYEALDKMAGGKRIVDTATLKSDVKAILKLIPEAERPPVLIDISQLPKMITYARAHSYRTILRALAMNENLMRSVPQHQLHEAAEAIDEAITATGEVLEKSGQKNVATALGQVDAEYAEGIAKFRDAQFNAWVKRARTKIFPDPSVVAEELINPGETQRLQEFMKLATPEYRARLAAHDMRNIFSSAEKSGNYAGVLWKEIERRGRMLDIVHGPDAANVLRRASKELADLEGQLPEGIARDSAGRAARALQEEAALTAQKDAFVKDNPIAAFANPKTADRAARAITFPGNEHVTEEAYRFFGPESDQWKALQTYALKSLITRAIGKAPNLKAVIIGDAMKKILQRYTKSQLKLLFGEGMEADLRLIADKADFLFPESTQEMQASLKAGSIKGRLPWTIRPWIKAWIWGWIGDHPQWFHYMAGTMRRAAKTGNWEEVRMMAKFFRTIAIRSYHQGPGYGFPHHRHHGHLTGGKPNVLPPPPPQPQPTP
jgi:polyhydroxyalkanoate synthesis regulator phasin